MTDHTTDTRADALSDAPLVPACPTPGWPGGYATTGASPFDGLLGVRVPSKLPPGVARHCVVDGKRIHCLSQLRPLLDMDDPTDRDRAAAISKALRSGRAEYMRDYMAGYRKSYTLRNRERVNAAARAAYARKKLARAHHATDTHTNPNPAKDTAA